MKLASRPTTIGTWALAIKRALDAQGINGGQLLKQANISPENCGDPNTRIPTEDLNALWALAESATEDRFIGLRVPMYVHATTLHAMSMANLASTSLLDAFERSARFSRIITTSVSFNVHKSSNTIRVEFSAEDAIPVSRHSLEASLLLCVKMTREIDFDPNNRPIEVNIPGHDDTDRLLLERAFGCTVISDEFSPHYILFDRSHAEASLPTANPEIIQVCERIMVDYLARLDKSDITYRVYQLILDLLPSGEPTQEKVADALHMSTRSLHRKLTSAGISFKTLLDNTRRDLALQYIRQSNLSIADITYNLGFYDASSFSRAFKRWTGRSPAKFRKEQNED